MKVLGKGIMPNGTHIQIEEWSENYSFHEYADTIASYPISKMTHESTYAPKAGEKYRFAFRFKNAEEAKKAFNELEAGAKTLTDFKELMSGKLEYRDCI